MAFRYDEAALNNYDRAVSYVIPSRRELNEQGRQDCLLAFNRMVTELGPVVNAYPSWHPLISSHQQNSPHLLPSETNGYKGLDHLVVFAHGFLACPYSSKDADSIIESVRNLEPHSSARITAQRMFEPFYSRDATAVLVKCEWNPGSLQGHLIKTGTAIPLMLRSELRAYELLGNTAHIAESWETMKPYLLGVPHGGVSSLFVNQETGKAIKGVWKALINTGMYGAILS